MNLQNPISKGLLWCIACEGGLNFKFVHFTCSSSTRARFLSTSYTASSLFFSFPTETLLYFSYEVFDIGMIFFCLFKIKKRKSDFLKWLKNKMLAVIVWTIILTKCYAYYGTRCYKVKKISMSKTSFWKSFSTDNVKFRKSTYTTDTLPIHF